MNCGEGYSRKNENKILKILILGILFLLLFTASKFFYGRLYFGEYKAPHKGVYTNHDYFIEMAGDNGDILAADYVMYMYSAFITMVGDREVISDRRVAETDYRIMLPKHRKEDLGVLNTNFEEQAPNCQRYYLTGEDGQEHKVFVLTGTQWETASAINVFYDLEKNLIIAPAESFDEEDFVDIEIRAESFSCEAVKMLTEMDETIQRITGDNHKWEISARQLLFIVFIAFLGMVAGRSFIAKTGAMAIWFVLPFGFMSQIFAMLLLIVSHLKISLPNYILVSCATAIFLNVCLKKSGNAKFAMGCDRKQLINILLWICGVLWFCFQPHVILSYDSVFNEYFGKYAALMGDLNPVLDKVSSYSLITPLYEIGSSLFGIELNYSIQPILVVSFMAAMGWIWLRLINNLPRVKIWIILWGMLALAVNPMFYIQMFWKLNNLSLGLFAGISVGMHLLYHSTGEKAYFTIGNLFFAITCIARIEGGVFAVIHLVCLYILFRNEDREKEVEILCLRTGLMLSALYLYFCLVIGQVESPFWTPQKGLAMNILVWLVYLLFKIGPCLKDGIKKTFYNIDKVMPVCLFVIIAVFGIMDGEKLIHNMFTYTVNLGNYGGYWVLVMVTALFGAFFQKGKPVIRFLSIYLLSYFLLIPGLMMVRETPLRIGFGDSACRMLSHVVIVGGYLLIYFANSIFTDNSRDLQNKKEAAAVKELER